MVEAVFEEGAGTESEVQRKIFLMHEVIEVLHPLLEHARAHVELAE